MVTEQPPCCIGLTPDDAEAALSRSGYRCVQIHAPVSRWLSPHRGPRVGRQRRRDDGVIELLIVQTPIIEGLPAQDGARPDPE